MQVNTSYNYNVSSNYRQPVFGAILPNLVNGYPTYLTQKSVNLIKKMSNHIDNTWAEIKKGKSLMDSPIFAIGDAENNLITVKPVYQGLKRLLLVEVDKGKSVDRILIDRAKPRDYRFERSIVTDYGSATVKTFNGLKQHNAEIEDMINGYIENYFPKILPKKDDRLTKTNIGLERL